MRQRQHRCRRQHGPQAGQLRVRAVAAGVPGMDQHQNGNGQRAEPVGEPPGLVAPADAVAGNRQDHESRQQHEGQNAGHQPFGGEGQGQLARGIERKRPGEGQRVKERMRQGEHQGGAGEQLVEAHGDVKADAAGDRAEAARQHEFHQQDREGHHRHAAGDLVHHRARRPAADGGQGERRQRDEEIEQDQRGGRHCSSPISHCDDTAPEAAGNARKPLGHMARKTSLRRQDLDTLRGKH